MKIAILGSTLWTAPSQTGKIHAPIKLTFDLAKGLARNGHKVVYFGLVTKKEIENAGPNLTINESYCRKIPKVGNQEKNFKVVFEASYFSRVLKGEANKFDLVYSHIYLVGLSAPFVDKPIVFTHHDSTRVDSYTEVFKGLNRPNLSIIPVSKYLRSLYTNGPALSPAILNGTDVNIFEPVPMDYYAWAGRISKPKGLHLAIKIAKKNKLLLKFAGPSGDHGGLGDAAKYSRTIGNLMKDAKNIDYLGTLSLSDTHRMISKAKAFIFPTDGTESFSMVVAESMCMGTPVIALRNGPMSELIVHGVTGYLCKNIEEMEKALKNIDRIDRVKCRSVAKEKLSLSNMVDNYDRAFIAIANNYSQI